MPRRPGSILRGAAHRLVTSAYAWGIRGCDLDSPRGFAACALDVHLMSSQICADSGITAGRDQLHSPHHVGSGRLLDVCWTSLGRLMDVRMRTSEQPTARSDLLSGPAASLPWPSWHDDGARTL